MTMTKKRQLYGDVKENLHNLWLQYQYLMTDSYKKAVEGQMNINDRLWNDYTILEIQNQRWCKTMNTEPSKAKTEIINKLLELTEQILKDYGHKMDSKDANRYYLIACGYREGLAEIDN